MSERLVYATARVEKMIQKNKRRKLTAVLLAPSLSWSLFHTHTSALCCNCNNNFCQASSRLEQRKPTIGVSNN